MQTVHEIPMYIHQNMNLLRVNRIHVGCPCITRIHLFLQRKFRSVEISLNGQFPQCFFVEDVDAPCQHPSECKALRRTIHNFDRTP